MIPTRNFNVKRWSRGKIEKVIVLQMKLVSILSHKTYVDPQIVRHCCKNDNHGTLTVNNIKHLHHPLIDESATCLKTLYKYMDNI